jgi:hypothetical protein
MKAMMRSDFEKWFGTMESEIQSMHDNQVWNLTNPIDGVRSIGCKWGSRKRQTTIGGERL